MSSKKKKEISYTEKMKLIKSAGLRGNKAVASRVNVIDELASIPERVERILAIVKNTKNAEDMLYFVMYDIEDNKIRKYVAQYLLEKGCIRLQKSVFLASGSRKVFQEISDTLKEVNSLYANADSIVLVPVSNDEIRAMRVIGKNIDISLFTDRPNTLII